MNNFTGISVNGVPYTNVEKEEGIGYAEYSLYENFPGDVANGIIDDYRSTTSTEQRKGIEKICEHSFAGKITGDIRKNIITAYRAGEASHERAKKKLIKFNKLANGNTKTSILV